MKLTKKTYPYMKDTVYQTKLDNGLTVVLLPKTDFHETYGMLTSQFGAVDTIFKPKGSSQFIQYPAGIAHFLEHKLFETEDDRDVLQEFAALGASANAYTSFHQTSYLFSTTEDVLPSLALLQRFVREPYFTEENVERERGIIGQEIEMYQDDADYRLYTGMLASLYPNTPLAVDIAGTVASVQDITAEALYENFELFYQPSNMSLFVIGNFDLEQVWQQIQSYQQAQLDDGQMVIERAELMKESIIEHRTETMEVAMPKLAFGLRGNNGFSIEEIQRYRLSLQLLFAMLLGWTSKRYQSLYEQGKIDSSFSFQLTVRPDYHFLVITGDTVEPIAVSSLLKKALLNFETDTDVTEEHLQLLKQEMMGDFIRSLNSLEFTASHFVSHGWEESIFDIPQTLMGICLEDVLDAGRRFIKQSEMTDFIIFPK